MTQDGETPVETPATDAQPTGQLELPMAAWERLRRAREDAGKTVPDLKVIEDVPRRLTGTDNA